MKLPDFNRFEPVLDLRRQMAATKTGHFELFDPDRHLTGEERSRLENRGVSVKLDALRLLPDMTLAIKNGRVVVFEKEKPVGKKAFFHLALCPELEALSDNALIATTCQSSPFPVLADKTRRSLSVCPVCLELLGYKGFSLNRNRRIRYSEQLMKHFELADFFRLYPLYPVRHGVQLSDVAPAASLPSSGLLSSAQRRRRR